MTCSQKTNKTDDSFEGCVTLTEDEDDIDVDIAQSTFKFPGLATARKGTSAVKKFWETKWKAQNFEILPKWLQDNEYLRNGHRPPLPSFFACFKSIFSLHTETGNIWTHMYGCVAFLGAALWFLTRPRPILHWMEKLVFTAFFIGAVTCLAMSFIFHTVACHSVAVTKLFSKLDYTGITLLIIGSFIPWLYFAFYCRRLPMLIYMSMITALGIGAMAVSLIDKFAQPKYRPIRAGVFMAMGLSAIVPSIHILIVDGIKFLFEEASLAWLMTMGSMYIIGATLYALRVPERFFPGRCDIWFQSHQLFHTLVIIAALIHFHGVTEMGMKRLMQGSCNEQLTQRYGLDHQISCVDKWFEGSY